MAKLTLKNVFPLIQWARYADQVAFVCSSFPEFRLEGTLDDLMYHARDPQYAEELVKLGIDTVYVYRCHSWKPGQIVTIYRLLPNGMWYKDGPAVYDRDFEFDLKGVRK